MDAMYESNIDENDYKCAPNAIFFILVLKVSFLFRTYCRLIFFCLPCVRVGGYVVLALRLVRNIFYAL